MTQASRTSTGRAVPYTEHREGVDIGSLFALEAAADVDRFGNKAANLRWLMDQGAAVPRTWVISPGVHITASQLDALAPRQRYAVRSSAAVEDGLDFSFAGQFTTKLDVDGREDVATAIQAVQTSAHRPEVATYLEHAGYEPATIEMGVVVQEMVPAVTSGVAFSRNPITGLDEVVIEAVPGRGDQLVGQGVTPERWVHRWGSFTEQPPSPSLPSSIAGEVVHQTRQIAGAYGQSVDVEWVWDGRQVWFVQLRPITGIDDITIFSNRIAREVMPGIIKPLVWSINVPVVNRAWIDLITEAIGPNDLQPEDLARSFGYRAYFNMGAFGDIFAAFGMPRESLELLLGLPEGDDQPSFKPTTATMKKTPRLAALAVRKMRLARRADAELARLRSDYESFSDKQFGSATTEQLFDDIDELKRITTRAASLNIVIPLLANMSNGLLRRTLLKAGLDPEQIEIISMNEMAEVNPQAAIAELGVAAASLAEHERDLVQARGYAAAPAFLRAQVDEFLERFGHFSMSGNDMSVPTWRETPDAIARMIVDTIHHENPSQQMPWDEAERAVPPIWRLPARRLHRRTRRLIGLREHVSSLYTHGYGLFRPYFLELGCRLVAADRLDDADDVMYLTDPELRVAFANPEIDQRGRVQSRKAEIETAELLDMPETIIGDDFIPVRRQLDSTGTLTGVPTARGRYRGTVRLVNAIDDFDRVAAGDVVAIPFSDVGWTPLFARAGAVVAEAGGMLSHSSIVAREYGIPCVVSVRGALQIPDGATVVVDGYEGTVRIDSDG